MRCRRSVATCNAYSRRVPLLILAGAELAYGLHPLLDGADLTVDDGERIGLIGRNGTGKSSLLDVIAARVELDGGEVRRRDGLSIARVEQEPQLPRASSLLKLTTVNSASMSFSEKTCRILVIAVS